MTLNEIEQAVTHLSPQDFAEFRRWFLELDAERWDEEIARDAAGGKFDEMAKEAVREHQEGKTRKL